MLDTLKLDFKQAFRHHLRRPWYFVIAVVILMLGTGVNGVVFSLINGVLLKPIGAHDPQNLVRMYSQSSATKQGRFTYPEFLEYSKPEVLKGALVTQIAGVSVREHGQTLGEVVSNTYFRVLGVSASEGRTFTETDEGRVAVISHKARERWYSGDAAVTGKEIQLNGDSFTVIGVAPPEFVGTFAGVSVDVWVPLREVNWLGAGILQNMDTPQLQMIARLAPGVSQEQAAAALSTTALQLENAFPRKTPRTGISVQPATLLHGNLRKGVSVFLSLMLGVAGLVLFTACANLANVALMTAAGRRKELAIRTALGASRFTLMRQFFVEGLLTAIVGGAFGLIVAHWAANAILHFNPIPSIPLSFDFATDARVVFFQIGVSLVAGIALGLIPALSMTRDDPAPALKEEAGGVSAQPSRMRFRQALVFAQIAVSLVLLIGAALFLRSLQNAAEMNPGFDPDHALAMDIDLSSRNVSMESGLVFYERLLSDIGALPGVAKATVSDLAPLDIATSRVAVMDPNSASELRISSNTVGVGYFEIMGVPLQQGRGFQNSDRAGTQPVVIINETMARRFWPGANPLGMSLRLPDRAEKPLTIIGIARDVKYRTLGEDPEAHMYLPFAQNYSPSMTLLVRTSSSPASMLSVVQEQVSRTDSSIQAFFARTLEQHMGFSLLPARLAATLTGVLGFIALIIACCGIYGSAGYSVSLRTREIGIRMALGARPKDVLLHELRRGLLVTAGGLLSGILLAVAVLRAAGGLLYGISPTDPSTYFLVSFALALASFVSIYLPSRRAVRIDPLSALRTE